MRFRLEAVRTPRLSQCARRVETAGPARLIPPEWRQGTNSAAVKFICYRRRSAAKGEAHSYAFRLATAAESLALSLRFSISRPVLPRTRGVGESWRRGKWIEKSAGSCSPGEQRLPTFFAPLDGDRP
jgi:hypothetical protein